MIEISYNAIEFWFCILFIVACGIQILFYLFFYMRISIIKRKKRTAIQEDPVSVIICARNEEENLKKFLPAFLEQKYSNYEVIVVNDSSEDDSEFVLNDFAKKYSHLRISTIKKDAKFSHGKKLAITIGIKAAKYEKMLFCDADCVPQSDQWLRLMQQSFRDKKEIILGYGGYQQQSGFLDKLIRYDTYSIAVNYMSFAHAGIPYMGVGRNLAYTKNIYEHLHEELTLTLLADHVGLNPSYLSKLFSKEKGMSIKSFIIQAKVSTAENLLRYSDFSCLEISLALGFSSQSAFISVFKKINGITPKKFRELHYLDVMEQNK